VELRTIRCDRCGATATVRGGTVPSRCSHCKGRIAPRPSGGNHRNPTPLRLGMKGRLMGRDYEVTGHLILSNVEEGVRYAWHEFQLAAPGGEVLYLEFDEGQWKAMVPFVPQQPLGPEQLAGTVKGARLSLDGSAATVQDSGRATVDFVEGELTWKAKAGDAVQYVDARAFNRVYTVEWRPEEIEFYRGKFLAEREVLTAFGLQQELAALDTLEKKRGSQQRFASICLALALFSFVGVAAALSSGRIAQRGSVPIDAITEEGVRFGPFTLEPKQRIYRLVVRGTMTQASAWVAGVLEAADGTELVGAQGDLWDESGYDDEAWHEWDLNAQTEFVIRKPGPYYLRLYAEKDPPGGSYGDASYELYAGAIYPGYLLAFGVFALVVALVFFAIANKERLARMAESSDD
jgi:hypothetical protein